MPRVVYTICMLRFIANWIVNGLALVLVSKILPGISLSDFKSALIAIAVISLINILLKPILIIFTLPITLLTLGLFTLIINAVLFNLAAMITPGFKIESFGVAFLGSLLYSIIASALRYLVK
jgi:putative membrane protein